MSEQATSSETPEQGIVSKVISFATSKRGMYIIAAVVLVAVAVYYFKSSKTLANEEDTIEENGDIPQAPPGYVTVPVEMVQGAMQQQGPVYGNVPQNSNVNFQTQQRLLEPQQQEEVVQHSQAPILKHNIDDEEEEEIAQQNLTKEEMESIQAQLNAMQQQRQSA